MLLSENLSQKRETARLDISTTLAVESLAKHLAATFENNGLESSVQQRKSLMAETGYSQPHSYDHLCQQLGLDLLKDFRPYQNGATSETLRLAKLVEESPQHFNGRNSKDSFDLGSNFQQLELHPPLRFSLPS